MALFISSRSKIIFPGMAVVSVSGILAVWVVGVQAISGVWSIGLVKLGMATHEDA